MVLGLLIKSLNQSVLFICPFFIQELTMNKKTIAIAVLLCMGPSTFAQDYLKSRCRTIVDNYDKKQIKRATDIAAYRELITQRSKAYIRGIVQREQKNQESLVEKLVKSAPNIDQFISDKNSLTPEQKKDANLIEMLNELLYGVNLRDELKPMLEELNAVGFQSGKYTASAMPQSVTVSRSFSVNGLDFEVSTSSHFVWANNKQNLVLLIVSNAYAANAPQVGISQAESSSGMKILDLETNNELAIIKNMDVLAWRGLTHTTQLTEPFSAWEKSAAEAAIPNEPEQVRSCRSVLSNK